MSRKEKHALSTCRCWFTYTFQRQFWIIEGPRAAIIVVRLSQFKHQTVEEPASSSMRYILIPFLLPFRSTSSFYSTSFAFYLPNCEKVIQTKLCKSGTFQTEPCLQHTRRQTGTKRETLSEKADVHVPAQNLQTII